MNWLTQQFVNAGGICKPLADYLATQGFLTAAGDEFTPETEKKYEKISPDDTTRKVYPKPAPGATAKLQTEYRKSVAAFIWKSMTEDQKAAIGNIQAQERNPAQSTQLGADV